MDKQERYAQALAFLSKAASRRRFLQMGVGTGLGVAGLAALAGCGSESSPASSAPTATTAPAAQPTATSVPGLTPTIAGGATAGPTAGADEVSYWERTEAPYGGSGLADRAIEAAKAETNKNPIHVVYPSGTRPNYDEPLISEWRNQTGIDIQLVEVGIGEITQKVIEGAVIKEPTWDVIATMPKDIGDLEGAGALVDWTDYAKELGQTISGKPWGYIGDAMPLYTTHYRGKLCGLLADNDTWILMYRKDLFDDPKEKEGFKKKYGYDMTMDTWEHYRDACDWFTRPDQNFYGANEFRTKLWGFWWWEVRYAVKSFPNQFYFDDDMHPLVNGPQGIAAMKEYVDLKTALPPDVISWDWTAHFPAFASGNAFSYVGWTSCFKYANDPATSKVMGKVVADLVPGQLVDGKFNRKSLFCYGQTLLGWKYGQASKKAAYAWAQWVTSPEIGPRSAAALGIVDPTRYSSMQNPIMVKTYTQRTLDMIVANGEMAAPELFMRGSNEYSQVLDSGCQEAFTGSLTPEQAMEQVATQWEEITDRVGRDTLKEVWAALKQYYPTTIPQPPSS